MTDGELLDPGRLLSFFIGHSNARSMTNKIFLHRTSAVIHGKLPSYFKREISSAKGGRFMRVPAKPFVIFVAALILGSATIGWAQVTTATLYGIVQDGSGAVLPGSQVVLTHEGTAAVRQAVTSEPCEIAV